MKENEILKQVLFHYIDLEYYANGVDDYFQMLLNELVEECNKAISTQNSLNTKLSYNTIMKIVKEEVSRFKGVLEDSLSEEAEKIVLSETQFLNHTFNNSFLSMGLTFAGLSAAKLLFAPVSGDDTAIQFAERTGENILKAYNTTLRSGYLFGQDTQELVNQVNTKIKKVSQGMKNGILTTIPNFAKTTDRIVFLNNEVEVTWVSTLDGKTCITCSSLSGLKFKSISEAPTNPHFLCRCLVIPSKAITEPVPDFEEFINSLNEEEQEHVLGANRFHLWKDYNVQLKNFINHGKVMSVKELNEKYATLKGNTNLVIPEQKFTEYALNPAKDPNKSRVFKNALGYSLDNYKDLEENIRNNLNQSDMEFVSENQYGQKYRCDVEITGPNGKTAVVRTGWIKEPDSDKLRMTTVYVR